MELTFGTAQVHTSERYRKNPKVAKLLNTVFGYTNVGNYARFTIFKKLIPKAFLEKNSKILDLGTGYGEYAFSLAKALPESNIHALDIDTQRISVVNSAIKLSETTNIQTHCKHIEQLEEDKFNFVFSIDVFEHIAPKEMPFKTVYNKLKPGGKFLVKIPNKNQKTIFPERYFEEHNDWLEEEHIGQVYDLNGLKARFESEGFKVTYSSYSDGWCSRFAWELAYLGKKLGVITQLITLPIAKAFIHLDRVLHKGSWGNAIQVIGQKPTL